MWQLLECRSDEECVKALTDGAYIREALPFPEGRLRTGFQVTVVLKSSLRHFLFGGVGILPLSHTPHLCQFYSFSLSLNYPSPQVFRKVE